MLQFHRLLPGISALLICISSAATQPQMRAQMSPPLIFEINRGQTAPQVRYIARGREGVMFFTSQGLTVSVPQVGSFRMLFENGNASEIAAEGRLASHSNYLSHDSPSLASVEHFRSVLYSSIYPGIDVRFYGQRQHLEHDFLLAPGADPSSIDLRLEGLNDFAVAPDGSLKLTLGKVTILETAPLAWQIAHGVRIPVHASWKQLGGARVGISVGNYNRNLPLVIDPVLVYSTYLGGATGLEGNSPFPAFTDIEFIRLDPEGNVYVAGTTKAIDYPTTAGAFDRNPNFIQKRRFPLETQSGFVSKFDKTGKILIYSTFLRLFVEAMAVDASGHVYTAEAKLSEAPDTLALDHRDLGVFVDKLSEDGSRLLYSNHFAQTTNSSPECQVNGFSDVGALAIDNAGHAWLVGSTVNPCLQATPGAFQTKLPKNDFTGFAAKFDTNKPSAESLVYSTYLGGSHQDFARMVTVDAEGNAYVAGSTASLDFPHGKVFGTDTSSTAFLLKLNTTGSALDFSILIHGIQGVKGIALDSLENIYIAGTTFSTVFPTTPGAFQRRLSGVSCGNPSLCFDGFVTKLNPDASALVYSTYLGEDEIAGLGLNNRGMVFVTGSTSSSDFPTTPNAFQKTLPANAENAFVTALQPDGRSLYYSTLLGGSFSTNGMSIFVDPAWNAWVAGGTADRDFPITPDAFQPVLKGQGSGFFAKVVIAADLSVSLHAASSYIERGKVETFTAQVTNHGPDGSDAIVLTDVIPDGFEFVGISGGTATSCSAPKAGATSGKKIICKRTRLESGQSFSVGIQLRAIGRSGVITNRVSTSARTQDLKESNNFASTKVVVQ